MQLISPMFMIALLVLTVPANAALPEDELLTIPLTVGGEDETYYVSVCRVNDEDLASATVKPNECFESGLWQETNGHGHLQSRSGLDGTTLYKSDTPVLL